MMYRISCLAHPVSHHPYARPRGATGSHGGPRRGTKKAVEQHGGPRGATAGSQKVRTHATGGHGGPRGATGGHGRQPKSPATPTAPFSILEDPYKLRLFGELITGPKGLKSSGGQKDLRVAGAAPPCLRCRPCQKRWTPLRPHVSRIEFRVSA